jgi:hypothetical protein
MAAIDIEAIRKKLSQIGQGNKDNKFKRWKYEKAGEYRLRVLPFKNADPGMPFPEKMVYYGIGRGGKGMIVSPENSGHKDPIKEFRISLFNDAKDKPKEEADELREMAKKLAVKTLTCVAVVDRAHESEGPMLWTPNWTDAQQLLALFLTEAGDYTDLSQGRDILLVVNPGKKRNQRTGESLLEAKISVSLSSGPAAKDDSLLKEWLANMPDPNIYYPTTSTEDTAMKLKEWLDGDQDDGSEGTSRGGSSASKVEQAPSPKQSVAAIAESMSSKVSASKKASPPKKALLQHVEDDLDAQLDDLSVDS